MWYLVLIFSAAFVLPAAAGYASLLRTSLDTKISWRMANTTILNNGLLGFGMFLLWFSKFQEDIHFLLGICVLLGLNGLKAVDWMIKVGKKMILNFAGVKEEEKKVEPTIPVPAPVTETK